MFSICAGFGREFGVRPTDFQRGRKNETVPMFEIGNSS
jgi:hypothetical protein